MSRIIEISRERFDHKNEERFILKANPGISIEVVKLISKSKNEPEWMLQKRLKCLEIFNSMPNPSWGPDISKLDLRNITFFATPDSKSNADRWEDLPEDIKNTFEKLGIPEAERKALGGAGAQYESVTVYHSLKKNLKEKGVIFEDFDYAVQNYPELVKKYFMTKCVSPYLHKYAALHGAVFSGGTFIYVPKEVKVDLPLQAYFRMNAEKLGQFEHTLIIVDEGAEVQYIEACSAPQYAHNSLHAGCVEIIVHKNARARYSSIENWSRNTYNLNTKRAVVDENGIIEWVNGNLGCLAGDSKVFTNPKGPVKISSIKPRDRVYVFDEKSNKIKTARVKAKIFSGDQKVYKLKAGGREIEATANHPFLTLIRKKNNPSHKKGFFNYKWSALENLSKGDIVAIAKKVPIIGKPYVLPQIESGEIVESKNQYSKFRMKTNHLYNDISIPKETNGDFMWLMGILIGDGYIDIKHNKINIATHISEDYRDHLCKLLNKLFNYKVTEKKERYIIINSKVLCQLFTKIGFSGKAGTKKIPAWIFSLPENQILAFLAGYFDADGHPSKATLVFTSINKPLLEDIKILGISLGFGVSQIFKHSNPGKVKILGVLTNAKASWRLHYNGHKIKELPIRCKLKKEKVRFDKIRRNYTSASGLNFKSKTNDEIGFARIDDIKEIGIRPTYDIEIDKYHNFVSNGIIVHNSHITMLYPTSVLIGENARADFLGIAFAGKGQTQDTGTKVYHLAPNTSSFTNSKSISKDGGITTYRGLIKVAKNAVNSKAKVNCDALMGDDKSVSNTIPYMEILNKESEVAHEATVGKISQESIFYLMSRGLSEEESTKMIVSGFIEPIAKELPLESALELNKLIELEMDGSLG